MVQLNLQQDYFKGWSLQLPKKISKEDNANLLEKAGFVTHDNYIPFLGKSHAAHTRKADAEHRKVNGWM